MREINTNILVVGGGLSGLLTAFTLSNSGNEIVLIDKNKLITKSNCTQDYRTTAISEGSKVFLEKINIWKKIESFAEPIKKIKVHDRKKINEINFKNEKNSSFLGYVVRNYILKNILINNIKKQRNLKIIEGESLKNIFNEKDFIFSFTDNYKFKSKLVVACDGKFSSVRNLLKTQKFSKQYKHSALVLNFSHTKNHHNTAYEIFYKSGPLALLPMKSISKKNFSTSLIWSHEKDYVQSIANIDKKLQKEIIYEKIQNYSGKIINIFDSKFFNLSAHINSKFFEKRLVYVGDAAHSIHPIAGQGWNLGIRDIKNILDVVTNFSSMGLDIGSVEACTKYNNMSYHDAFSLYQITDKLNNIFLNDSKLVKYSRFVGFKLIEKNQSIKKLISNYAMGL